MRRQQFFLNIFSSQTAQPIWTKLGRNVPWEVLFKNCSQNLIPSKTLVAMVIKWNFLSNSLKISSPGIAGPILELFHRNVPWVNLFKKCLRNFDPSINMALVNGGFLHYMDMRKFLKKSSSLKLLSRFWNIFTGMFLGWLFKKMFAKFWSVNKHGSGEWGLLALYRHEEIS